MWMCSTVFSLNYLSFDTRDSICNLFRSIQKKRCGNSSFFVWLFCHLSKEIAIVFISPSVPSFFFNVISGNDHLSSSQPAMVDTADVYITSHSWHGTLQPKREDTRLSTTGTERNVNYLCLHHLLFQHGKWKKAIPIKTLVIISLGPGHKLQDILGQSLHKRVCAVRYIRLTFERRRTQIFNSHANI